jgi:hypothetical protein
MSRAGSAIRACLTQMHKKPLVKFNITMSEHQVTCITKSHPNGGHEHITHIGGSAGGGWRLPKETAIQRIDAKSEAYYTVDRTTNRRVDIGVVRESGKAPYLRTHADGKWNDNLLAQAACPGS